MSKRGAAMAKDQVVKLIVGAGQANPSPPVGPALGSKGVKSIDFCKVRRKRSLSNFRVCSCSRPVSVSPYAGIQRADVTYHPGHADARAGDGTGRPVIPLRHSDAADVVAAQERRCLSAGEEGREEEGRVAARSRGRRHHQPEARLRGRQDQAVRAAPVRAPPRRPLQIRHLPVQIHRHRGRPMIPDSAIL